MTRDEMVARIQRLLAFRSDKSLEIQAAIIDAQNRLEQGQFLPWFLKTEVASISTVSGEERVPLPTEFLREDEDGALWYYNGAATNAEDVWRELRKGFLDQLRAEYPGEGAPCAYYLDYCYFRIFPTPDDAYTLKMRFFKEDAKLTTNFENKWSKLAPELLVGMAGFEIASALRDTAAMQTFALIRDADLNRLVGQDTAREGENFRYIMGGSN